MRTYVVIVGTVPGTGRGMYAEFTGQQSWGPYSLERADELAAAVQREWDQIPKENFVYGTPFVKVEPLLAHDSRAMGLTEERAMARNWHLSD